MANETCIVRLRSALASLVGRVRGRRGEGGIALISVVVVLAIIATSAADFAYNARVELASAVNARDDLQAHYHARSAVNLGRLLLKVQSKLGGASQKLLGGMDIQLADYAPFLISAFNSAEEAQMLGSMFGVEQGAIRGLGVENGRFDLEMKSLDGRLNLNCAGGPNPGAPAVVRFASALASLMRPDRYNRLFEEPDQDGQYADRLEMMRAIIDWADQDTVIFGSAAVEDYRYNEGEDRYENKNQYYDTLEELRLVKGVDDDFMAAFGDALTVYGDCKINVSLASAPLIVGLIAQYAQPESNLALEQRNLLLLGRYVVLTREMMGGFSDAGAFIKTVEDPTSQLATAFAFENVLSGGAGEGAGGVPGGLPPVTGIKLSPEVNDAITVGGTRRIWQIIASAEVGRVRKRVTAIWDTEHISMHAHRQQFGKGTFVYWREE